MKKPWDFLKFFAEEEHCPVGHIRDLLANVLFVSGAKSALLAVVHGRTLFGSLLLHACRNGNRHRTQLVRLAKKYPPPVPIDSYGGLENTGLQPWAMKLVRSSAAYSWLASGQLKIILPKYRSAVRPHPAASGPAVPILFLSAPKSAVPQDQLRTLRAAVNATDVVLLHKARKRLQETGKRFSLSEKDKQISPLSLSPGHIRKWADMPLCDRYLDILRQDLALTSASLVGIDHDGKIEPATALGKRRAITRLERRLADTAASDNRAIIHQINRGKLVSWLMVVPVEQTTLLGRDALVGLLIARKLCARGATAFSMLDIASAEAVARRLSALRVRLQLLYAFGFSAHLLKRLSRREAVDCAERLLETDRTSLSQVPADLLSSEPQIRQVLIWLHELTRSHSVTVRLLDYTGEYLVRFSSSDESGQHRTPDAGGEKDPFAAIRILSAFSVNAWVARHGKECYMPDTRDATVLMNYEGLKGIAQVKERNTHSEFCYPLFVRSRLLGTLNLESRLPNAFSESQPLIRAFAEHVALCLEQSIVTEDAKLEPLLAREQQGNHTLEKVMKELNAAVDVPLTPVDRARLAEVMRAVLIEQKPLGCAPQPRSVAEIIEAELKRDAYETHCEISYLREANDTEDMARQRLEAHHAEAFQMAFSEIFCNARKYTIAGPRYRSNISEDYNSHEKRSRRAERLWGGEIWVRVFVGTSFVGGNKRITLRVEHPIACPIPLADAMRIYRSPVLRDGQPHKGAFFAGQQLRYCGGDIYLCRNDHFFACRIEIPAAFSS